MNWLIYMIIVFSFWWSHEEERKCPGAGVVRWYYRPAPPPDCPKPNPRNFSSGLYDQKKYWYENPVEFPWPRR
ncbi:MAG: hypothetical protein GY937_20030 [bacterium]|nr:hypothetical protein [bacterium]